MLNYLELPSTTARPSNSKFVPPLNGIKFTFLSGHDERILYEKLNEELCQLESSLDINKEKLDAIEQKLTLFLLELELKDEILLRVKWLENLYEVYEAIQSQSISTKEQAKQLLIKIAPAKLGPLRTNIKKELQTLQKSLPSEGIVQLTPEQELIEKMNNEGCIPFENLGESGREFVIKEALSRYGDDVSVELVKEISLEIDNSVKSLKNIKEPVELLTVLNTLPITVLSTLTNKRKNEIAKRLLELKEWETFESLNRIVKLLNKVISIEERKKKEAKNFIQLNEGKEAFTVRIDKDNNGLIKIG